MITINRVFETEHLIVAVGYANVLSTFSTKDMMHFVSSKANSSVNIRNRQKYHHTLLHVHLWLILCNATSVYRLVFVYWQQYMYRTYW